MQNPFHTFRQWAYQWASTVSAGNHVPYTAKKKGTHVLYPFQLKKITVNNIRIAYVDEGPGESGTLLFIHGVGGGIPLWSKSIPLLSRHYRCIAIDLPGHGYSDKKKIPYSISFYREVLLDFMAALELPPVILAGHSMGGQIAMATALHVPERVEQLILAAPSGLEPYTPFEKQFLLSMFAGAVLSGGAFAHHRMNYLAGCSHEPVLATELVSKLAFFQHEAVEFAEMMLGSVYGILMEDAAHIVPGLRQPSLVIAGRKDFTSHYQFMHGRLFCDVITAQAGKLPDHRISIYEDCGHFIPYEKPGRFSEDVLRFLEERRQQQ